MSVRRVQGEPKDRKCTAAIWLFFRRGPCSVDSTEGGKKSRGMARQAAHVADYVREQGHFAAPSMGGLQLHVHGAAAGCGRIWVDFDLGMKLLGNNWLGS